MPAMNVLTNIAASTLSLPPDTYIYSIVPTSNNALAAISSNDSLSIFDATTLAVLPSGHFADVHEGVTCLQKWADDENYLVTAGRDHHVRCWDSRSQQRVFDAGEHVYVGSSCNGERLNSDRLQCAGVGPGLLTAWQDGGCWDGVCKPSICCNALVCSSVPHQNTWTSRT